MSRRLRAVAALAALLTFATALPGLPSPATAASCSGWSSSVTPPPTIQVLRHASGVVETVNFRAYAKNVLSREWIASWTTESLRSGALAVKHYAWYQVLHWRGGTNTAGDCFDVRDDTADQVYDPSRPTYASAAAAVDATWATLVLKNGSIFPTYYDSGVPGEACGANASGWRMYQWGTQACGLAGKTAAQIVLTYYYPGVTVTDAPVPMQAPAPTSTLKRPTASKPTSIPRPTDTQQPAAGQATSQADVPSSPSADNASRSTAAPESPATPTVKPEPDAEPAVLRTTAKRPHAEPLPVSPASLRWSLYRADPGGFIASSPEAAAQVIGMPPVTSGRARLAAFSVMWRAALDQLARELASRF